MRPETSEAELMAEVRKLAKQLGWLVYHTHRSDRSEAGFPDLVLVRPPFVLYRELKSEKGRLRKEQEVWLHTLGEAGQDVGVWKPHDMAPNGRIPRELSRTRRAA